MHYKHHGSCQTSMTRLPFFQTQTFLHLIAGTERPRTTECGAGSCTSASCRRTMRSLLSTSMGTSRFGFYLSLGQILTMLTPAAVVDNCWRFKLTLEPTGASRPQAGFIQISVWPGHLPIPRGSFPSARSAQHRVKHETAVFP